jgi:hypothetical protein
MVHGQVWADRRSGAQMYPASAARRLMETQRPDRAK